MKTISTLFPALFSAVLLAGQTPANFWRDVSYREIFLPETAETGDMPEYYRTVSLDIEALRRHLRDAPAEGSAPAKSGALQVLLPMPDGSMEAFKVWDSPVMHPELAAKYPMIRTFAGRGISNPVYIVRFGFGPDGFHAVVSGENEGAIISPYASHQDRYYLSYGFNNIPIDTEALPIVIGDGENSSILDQPQNALQFRGGGEGAITQLRTYRFALACTGEYAALHGGTVENVMSSFVQATNAMNTLLERDHGIRLQLISNNDILIYLDANADPYTQTPDAGMVLSQNVNILNQAIGISNYDVGHVFTRSPCNTPTGGFGGAVANNSFICKLNKGAGVTCHNSTNVVAIALDIAAHEMGHQFNAGHTFNNCPGSEDQFHLNSAFEPGSGSTLISYNGSCGSGNNISGGKISYYHSGSIEEFWNTTRMGVGSECGLLTESNNHSPSVELPYQDGFFIPISTPFELTAIATDEDNDPLTYSWEQINLGPMVPLGTPVSTAPSFRVFPPVTSPTRVFPKLSAILSNSSNIEEVLPTYSRNLKFRCLVRDNNISEGAGGVTWKDVSFEATAAAGPFLVTKPNTSATVWKAGQLVEVTWDVANTDNGKVNCKSVNIRLSMNGGNTFPITLISHTPNDGSEMVYVPDVTSVAARVRVEAADNIFFDLSNESFQIQAAETPSFTLSATTQWQQICLPESAQTEILTGAVQGFDQPLNLEIVEGLPDGAGVSFSQNPVLPGASSQLMLDMSSETSNGNFEVLVRATGGTDTAYLPLYFKVIYSDFSSLALESPADGAAGQNLLPTFTWTDLPQADLYDFQLATSPTFDSASIINQVFNIAIASHVPNIASLLENKIYYWRVRPSNECSEGDWTLPATFQTFQVVCTPFNSTNVPVSISSVGTPTIESTLTIVQNGIITDLNVSKLKGNHDALPHIEASLVSPAGTEVVLFSRICGNVAVFDMALDDEAPNAIACPPINGLKYKPQNPLSVFDGENTLGTWKMKIKVVDNAGQGGSLQAWGLEFCSSVSPNHPFVVKNDTLILPPLATGAIHNLFLSVEDTDNSADQLQFTVVANTQAGFVSKDGVQIPVGGHFTMKDINDGKVSYTNTDPDALSDFFTFIVEDGTGGWLGTPKFNIKIDPDAPNATDEEIFANSILLFPNPAKNLLNVSFRQPLPGDARLSVTDIAGRQVKTQTVGKTQSHLEINLDGFADGLYFLNVRTKAGVFVKKFLVAR